MDSVLEAVYSLISIQQMTGVKDKPRKVSYTQLEQNLLIYIDLSTSALILLEIPFKDKDQ